MANETEQLTRLDDQALGASRTTAAFRITTMATSMIIATVATDRLICPNPLPLHASRPVHPRSSF
jgi:hypothetical protein